MLHIAINLGQCYFDVIKSKNNHLAVNNCFYCIMLTVEEYKKKGIILRRRIKLQFNTEITMAYYTVFRLQISLYLIRVQKLP
jgi:hypothetical protein